MFSASAAGCRVHLPASVNPMWWSTFLGLSAHGSALDWVLGSGLLPAQPRLLAGIFALKIFFCWPPLSSSPKYFWNDAYFFTVSIFGKYTFFLIHIVHECFLNLLHAYILCCLLPPEINANPAISITLLYVCYIYTCLHKTYMSANFFWEGPDNHILSFVGLWWICCIYVFSSFYKPSKL